MRDGKAARRRSVERCRDQGQQRYHQQQHQQRHHQLHTQFRNEIVSFMDTDLDAVVAFDPQGPGLFQLALKAERFKSYAKRPIS
jgi:hypothetical protein